MGMLRVMSGLRIVLVIFVLLKFVMFLVMRIRFGFFFLRIFVSFFIFLSFL